MASSTFLYTLTGTRVGPRVRANAGGGRGRRPSPGHRSTSSMPRRTELRTARHTGANSPVVASPGARCHDARCIMTNLVAQQCPRHDRQASEAQHETAQSAGRLQRWHRAKITDRSRAPSSQEYASDNEPWCSICRRGCANHVAHSTPLCPAEWWQHGHGRTVHTTHTGAGGSRVFGIKYSVFEVHVAQVQRGHPSHPHAGRPVWRVGPEQRRGDDRDPVLTPVCPGAGRDNGCVEQVAADLLP